MNSSSKAKSHNVGSYDAPHHERVACAEVGGRSRAGPGIDRRPMRILKRFGYILLLVYVFAVLGVMESSGVNPLQPIHYWNFNDTNNLLTASFTAGGGTLNIDTGTASVVLFAMGQDFFGENARFGDPIGAHLRLNNPIGATNTLVLPTTGFEDIVLKYETRRSGQGAGLQVLEYSTNGIHYTHLTDIITYNNAPELHIMDLTGIEGVDNNSDFTKGIIVLITLPWKAGRKAYPPSRQR